MSSYIIEDCETEVLPETEEQAIPITLLQSTENTMEDTADAKLWPSAPIAALIVHVKSHQSEFNNTRFKKIVWEKIAKLLNEKFNKSYTSIQCDTKWKGLVQKYRDIKTNNATSGKSRKYWELYDAMNDMLHKKPEITPVATCSNSKGLVTPALSKTLQDKRADGSAVVSGSAATNESGVFESSFQRKRKANDNPAERRHREKMARMDRYLDTFEKLGTKINVEKKEPSDSE